MTHPLSRRSALLGTAAVTGLALWDAPAEAVSRAAADTAAFDAARERWVSLLAGASYDAAYLEKTQAVEGSANAVLRKLAFAPGRPSLWPDLPLDDPRTGNFNRSYNRMRTLALGWATPGTALHGDPRVAETAVRALDFLYEHAYHEKLDRRGSNWYWWEIGVPRALTDTCALLYDGLPKDHLARWLRPLRRWCPDPERRISHPGVVETGANRAGKAMAVAMRGLLTHDARLVRRASRAVADLLRTTRGPGDGFYRDGSFIQHDVYPYTGSYGVDYLESVAKLIAMLAASPWEIRDIDDVYAIVDRSFVPFVFDGLMMDCVRGRQITVQGHRDHHSGHKTVEAMLTLLDAAPRRYAERWRPLIKGWLTRNQAVPYQAYAPLAGIAKAKALLEDPSVPAGPRTTGTYVFADMDRVVHRRPTWAFAIAMSSERIGAAEAMNLENLRGWYTGDGMTYLYSEDLTHWNDDLWPTIDPYRLPGTTVDTRRRADLRHGKRRLPPTPWAGGVALDGEYGVAAMKLVAGGSSLRAKKAWFLLDDAVIALGAGITASDGRRVETVVENRNTHDGHPPLTRGDGWLHLSGVAGYALLDGEGVKVIRERRTGRWHDIDQGATTGGDRTPVTRHYTTVVIDHGRDPRKARYAYAVLPGASVAQTAAYRGRTAVLANSGTVQAVSRDDLVAAVFWRPGSVETALGPLTADGPCTLLARRDGRRVRLAVADPSRTAREVRITLPWPVTSLERHDRGVRRTRKAIEVEVAGSRGHARTAVLRA
ncbi:polysaccharide lyase 8 family protein [Actinomadura sp. ATCC 31491]|uniref:Polysaccharide lyase 8 family protein n=1 Tax=Actinomadura luzonensis TaxID=2805427 RepID=A0ABT0G229_9ACTN|nr:polysaccharide lyase 8 family protein [Actinomadura luzonensis]MCK2218644.1 polysaccharide lyase 8 family protein [Actinomadura luzonensis]